MLGLSLTVSHGCSPHARQCAHSRANARTDKAMASSFFQVARGHVARRVEKSTRAALPSAVEGYIALDTSEAASKHASVTSLSPPSQGASSLGGDGGSDGTLKIPLRPLRLSKLKASRFSVGPTCDRTKPEGRLSPSAESRVPQTLGVWVWVLFNHCRLWTGVPTRHDKNICRFYGAPACRVFLIT